MQDIDGFLEALASKEPVPGGGSVAGLELAMGASLLAMVCELTLGREKYAAVAIEVEAIRDRARDIAARGRRLVTEDTAAFQAVSDAMKLPRATDDEKAARREAVQLALKGAVDPPLETMRLAHEASWLAVDLAPIGNASAISDVGSGSFALEAAFFSAKLNVDINLASIRDDAFLAHIRGRLPVSAEVVDARQQVVALVEESIGPAA